MATGSRIRRGKASSHKENGLSCDGIGHDWTVGDSMGDRSRNKEVDAGVDGWKASQERGLLSSEGSRIHYEIASTRCKFDL